MALKLFKPLESLGYLTAFMASRILASSSSYNSGLSFKRAFTASLP